MKFKKILNKINDGIISRENSRQDGEIFKYNKRETRFLCSSDTDQIKNLDSKNSIRRTTTLVQKTKEEKICRICRLSGYKTKEELVSPCACKGTLAYIHRTCLEKWLKRSGTTYCELCRFTYTVKIVEKYSKINSVRKWLTDEENFDDVQDLIVDGVLAITFLPIIFICCYGFALVYSEAPSINTIFMLSRNSYEIKQKLWIVFMFGCVTISIMACYFCWIALRSLHYHKKWSNWIRRNGKLHLILSKKNL